MVFISAEERMFGISFLFFIFSSHIPFSFDFSFPLPQLYALFFKTIMCSYKIVLAKSHVASEFS